MTLKERIRAALTRKRDYEQVFGTEQGQRVLADIMRRAGVTAPRFYSDTNVLHHQEGMRRLAMSIFNQVHSGEERLTRMVEQATEEEDEI